MKSIDEKIGFMQGRLSSMTDDRVQFFPWDRWEQEFQIASQIPVCLMEWTLDHERIYENPLMTNEGQKKIIELCKRWNLTIPSLTADCFMQAPFWKACDGEKKKLIQEYLNVVNACANLGIKIIVIPLVDNGSIDNEAQENALIKTLLHHVDLIENKGLKIAFESDYAPLKLQQFITQLPLQYFGVNFDMGNSAGLGFNAGDEFELYGDRIFNVHVKDRIRNGRTVPLGLGNVNFNEVFLGLANLGYQGNFILQTARFENDDNVELIKKYKNMVGQFILTNTKK